MKLAKVRLDGWKGITREVDLSAPRIFLGPNGRGKSAVLDAVQYALTGSTPSGSSTDAVAAYFSGGVGTVRLDLQDGTSILRGLSRDAVKRTRTKILEGHEENFLAERAVLRLSEFSGLSPNKRREYFIRLLGGKALDARELLGEIDLAFVQDVGGPVATADLLEKLEIMPPAIRKSFGAYKEFRSAMESLLAPHVRKRTSIAEAAQLIVDEANAAKLSAQKILKQSDAAARELTRDYEAAKTSEREIANAKAELSRANEALLEEREKLGQIQGSERRRKELVARLKALEASSTVQADEPPDLTELEARKTALGVEHGVAKKAFDSVVYQVKYRDELRAESERLSAELAVDPPGETFVEKVWKIVRDLPDDLFAGCSELKCLVGDEVSLSLEATEQAIARRRELALRKSTVDLNIASYSAVELDAKLGNLVVTLDNITASCESLDEEILAAQQAVKKYESWRIEQAGFAGRHETLTRELASVEKELVDLGEAKIVERENEFARARDRLEALKKETAVLASYRDACERRDAYRVRYDALSSAEKAAKSVREMIVMTSMQTFLSDVDAVVSAALPAERAFVDLVSERGGSIFRLGLVSTKGFRDLDALSGGETAIFAAAIALAIAKRSELLKVLLLEADPIDEENSKRLLEVLERVNGDLDGLLVASSREVQYGATWAAEVLA